MNGPATLCACETVDEGLIAYYREASATGDQFQGLSIVPHAKDLGGLIEHSGAKLLLDYGCGLGHQYTREGLHRRWGVTVPTLYDPGVKGFDAKPEGVFDGVICSDVMEHVPERLVDAVLAELFGYATMWVWLSICCRPAKKFFPGGVTNLHVTVRPRAWWAGRVAAQSGGKRYRIVFTP